jgi:hypothetical protein
MSAPEPTPTRQQLLNRIDLQQDVIIVLTAFAAIAWTVLVCILLYSL